MTTDYCPYILVVLLQLDCLLVRQAQKINLTTNQGGDVEKSRPFLKMSHKDAFNDELYFFHCHFLRN